MNRHAITCIDHTDKEREAITCPCCLKSRAEKAEAINTETLSIIRNCNASIESLKADRARLYDALLACYQFQNVPSQIVATVNEAIAPSKGKDSK